MFFVVRVSGTDLGDFGFFGTDLGDFGFFGTD